MAASVLFCKTGQDAWSRKVLTAVPRRFSLKFGFRLFCSYDVRWAPESLLQQLPVPTGGYCSQIVRVFRRVAEVVLHGRVGAEIVPRKPTVGVRKPTGALDAPRRGDIVIIYGL